MPELIIDNNFVKPYFAQKRGGQYAQALDIYHHMSFHADGYFLKPNVESANQNDAGKWNPYFKRLIDELRPSESDTIKAYRRIIYVPKTKGPCYKVYSSLRKIVKSQDWKIDYTKALKPPSSIADGEYLEDYCEKNYPYFNTLENWIYSYALKFMLIDPNGLVVVRPKEWEVDESEFRQPYSYLIPSRNVYDYHAGEYAVYLADEKSQFTDSKGIAREGIIIMVATKTSFFQCSQTDSDRNFKIEEVYRHNIGHLPAWKIGGTIKDWAAGNPLYESFLAPMLPDLDTAAREWSDLQAEVTQHIFTTLWYYSGQDCTQCNGLGKVKKAGAESVCPRCGGQGVMPKSPYKDVVVKAPGVDEKQAPTPPMGYVQKNVEIVKIQDERIKGHIYDAMSTINMEFLAEAPLNQSGVAKEVDKDELNNYVYSVAYHLVENVLVDIYYFVNEMRYKDSIPNPDTRDEMLPRINIPQRFDLLTESVLEARLKNITESKVDPEIKKQVQLDFINSTFSDLPEVRDKLATILMLDPFSNYTPSEKSDLSLTKMVLKEDIILSIYINSLVERAVNEDKTFLQMDYKAKMEKLMGYVDEIIAEMENPEGDAAAAPAADPNPAAAV